MTDVKSTWTHPRAILNKARVHTVAATDYLKRVFPFKSKGVDSDNGSEFINEHFLTYCNENDLVFTRRGTLTQGNNIFKLELFDFLRTLRAVLFPTSYPKVRVILCALTHF